MLSITSSWANFTWLATLSVNGLPAGSRTRFELANLVAGQANLNPYTFYLPAIDTPYEVEVLPNQETVVRTPGVPGVQMTIPAGANLRNRDGTPVARVSLTPVPIGGGSIGCNP